MICRVCGKEFKDRLWKGNLVIYCSRKCYNNMYWKTTKEERLAYFRERYRQFRILHPKQLKYNSKEERYKAHLEYAKNYYLEHKEYYKQKNKEWYQRHKNDEDFKLRHKKAVEKYRNKLKENNKYGN